MTHIHRVFLAAWVVTSAISMPALCCDTSGRVVGLQADAAAVNALDAGRMSIVRDNRTLPIADGMLVCKGDVITARSGVVAKILAGTDPVEGSIVTLIGEATITVEDPHSITVQLGRIFALLRGAFDLRTLSGVFAARGTEFELSVSASEAKIVQLEGFVEVLKGSAATGPKVNPLQEVILTNAQEVPEPRGIEPGVCAKLTRTNSEMISSTQPRLPLEVSGRSADRESLAKDFANARERLICAGDAEAAAMLARTWANYAEPAGVLKLATKIPPTTGSRDAAIYYNNVGSAHRQVGDSNMALEYFKRALEINPAFGFAWNGLGDAHRDLGLAALARVDNAGALSEFNAAQQSYEKALGPALWGAGGGANRAIPLVNLGELLLLRVALSPGDSDSLVDRARQYFENANTVAGPKYPFAELGLARVDFMRAKLVERIVLEGATTTKQILQQGLMDIAVGVIQDGWSRKAQRRLDALRASYPDFSAASQLLGDIYAAGSNEKEAAKHYRDAIRFDPRNVFAYKRLADVGTRAEKQLYRTALTSIVYPALAPVFEGRVMAVNDAKLPPQTVDVRALIPSVAKLTFGSGNNQMSQSVAFKNAGDAAVTVGQVAISGDNASAFAVAGDGCGNRSLAPDASCEIHVRFIGQQEGTQSARLVVGSSTGTDAKVALKAVWEKVLVTAVDY